ncbi:MAG: hypothetical protein M3Z35_03545 [Nitrospirota bacterium]|nr:hypothetical protein [Nitrospirota bacterium]
MKQAHRPSLQRLFTDRRSQEQVIQEAYCQYGYRLAEIAEHLGGTTRRSAGG